MNYNVYAHDPSPCPLPATQGEGTSLFLTIILTLLISTHLAFATPIPLTNTEDSNPLLVDHDDYIVRFKANSEPLTLREALDVALIPPRFKSLPIEETLKYLASLGDQVEEVVPLADILAFLRTPKQEALPMLMSDIRRDGHIFNLDQIKHPETIIQKKMAKLFDLRSVFFDIENSEQPGQKRSINLSAALRSNILPFKEIADILLNRMPQSDRIVFGVRRGLMGMYFSPIDPNDMNRLAQGGGVDGFCMNTMCWLENSAVSVSSANYTSVSGLPGSLQNCATMIFTQNQYYENNNSCFSAQVCANVQNASLCPAYATDFGAICPWYGYGNDFHGFGLDGTMNINNSDLLNALSGGAFVVMGSNYVGIGVAGSLHSSMGSINMSASYSRSKDREVSITKPEKMFEKEHKYKVIIADSKGKGLRVTLGVSEPTTGLGVAISAGKNSSASTSYKTHLPKSEALLYQEDGEKAGFERLGKKFMTAHLPSLENPLQWQEGDEIITNKTGSYFGAFIMGVSQALPLPDLIVGASVEVSASYELQVKRLEKALVEVCINPTKFEEKGVFARLLNVAGATATHGVALALKQKFVFDFSGANGADLFAAQTAYKQLINYGHLPCELESKFNLISEENHAGHLIEQFARENEQLKTKGVTRQSMEIVRLDHDRFAAMAGVDIVGAKIVSVEKIRAAGQRIMACENAAVESKISIAKKSKSRFRTGQSSKNAYATTNYIWQNPQSGIYNHQFYNLVLTAEISDSKITGKDENRMRDQLNEIFGLDFDAFTLKAHKQSRSVILERELTSEDLFNLRDAQSVESAIKHSSIAMKDIRTFVGSLSNQGPQIIAEKVRDFVGEHGISGFGVIHFLLGSSVKDMKVRTSSSLYTDPITHAEQFVISWTDIHEKSQELRAHIKSNSDYFEIQQFFEEGQEILDDLYLARTALLDDKFMIDDNDPRKWPEDIREDKKVMRTLLKESSNSISEILSLNHLSSSEKLAIYKKIKAQKLNLEQKILILEAKFRQPIQARERRSQLRKRFKHADNLLAQIKDQMTVTKTDAVLDGEEKEQLSIKHLQLTQRVQAIISLKRLTHAKHYDSLLENLAREHSLLDLNYHQHKEQELRLHARLTTAKNNFLEEQRLAQMTKQSAEEQERGVFLPDLKVMQELPIF